MIPLKRVPETSERFAGVQKRKARYWQSVAGFLLDAI